MLEKIIPEKFRRFFVFGLVGTVGFLVDSAVLLLATSQLGLDPYAGRVVSYLVAATATWMGNRFFTFRDRPQTSAGRQWVLFVAVCGIGFLVNYGTYALLISFIPLVWHYPVLGVAAGAIAGMFFNFFSSARFVFPKA